MERTAEALGISAVVVQELKSQRMSIKKFNWDDTLKFKGDTGVFLQYTHARLCRYVMAILTTNEPWTMTSLHEVSAHNHRLSNFKCHNKLS